MAAAAREIMMEEERQKRGWDITGSKRQSELKKYDSYSGVEDGTNWQEHLLSCLPLILSSPISPIPSLPAHLLRGRQICMVRRKEHLRLYIQQSIKLTAIS